MSGESGSSRKGLHDHLDAVHKRIEESKAQIRSNPRDGLAHLLLAGNYFGVSKLSANDPCQAVHWSRHAWKEFDEAITILQAVFSSHNDDDLKTLIGDAMTGRVRAAYSSGDKESTSRFANELLGMVESLPNDEGGDAVFYCHHLLGLIALDNGNLADAKDHCLKSSMSHGSPGLQTSGPSMSLALRLLEEGEAETSSSVSR